MSASLPPPKLALRADWVLRRVKSLSDFVDDMAQGDDSAEDCLEQLSRCLSILHDQIINESSKIASLTAADATVDRLVSLFKLTIPSRVDAAKHEYKPASEPVVVPESLVTTLTRLDGIDSDTGSGVESLLMEVCAIVGSNGGSPTASAPSDDNLETSHPQVIKIVRQYDISLIVTDPATQQPLKVSGCASRAFGYGTRKDMSSYVVVVEMESADTFSAGYVQLLTYLAIMRQRRIQEGAQNIAVQGFFTDGVQYRFVMIKADGVVVQSRLYEVFLDGQLQTIFNFVLNMARSCSPGSTATGGNLRSGDVAAIAQSVESLMVGEDEGYYVLPMKN